MSGLELKKLRKKANLSQEEFGKEVGLSKNTVYNYENGGVIPKTKIPILVNFFKNLDLDLTKKSTPFKINGEDVLFSDLAKFIAENEMIFMKEKVFSNIIDIRVAKKLAKIIYSKESLLDYLKE